MFSVRHALCIHMFEYLAVQTECSWQKCVIYICISRKDNQVLKVVFAHYYTQLVNTRPKA